MVNFGAKKIYDPTAGRLVREIKQSDLFYLGTNGAVTGSAGTVLATTTTGTNKILYLTGFVVGAKQNSSVYVLADSSTILPVTLGANDRFSVSGRLYKLDCTTAKTVSIVATDAGTYTAFLVGYYEPIVSKVETA